MSTAAKRRKERIVLATDKDGRDIYVQLRASGISQLVALVDGLPLTFFGKGKTAYLKVSTALEWFERELGSSPGDKNYEMAITAYRRVLDHFAQGKINFS